MSEVYPTDNTLLNIQSDGETGIEYIPTGKSPYYLEFRKLLYRLLLATKKANELRVYDQGGLNIGVKAGGFWVDTQLVEVGASSGNTLADNKDNIYIYLNSDGQLVIDEYNGFADMKTTAQLRLAIVTTADGDISLITDCRGSHNFTLPFGSEGIKRQIEVHTSDDTLTCVESASVHTNLGATGTITLTLPSEAPEGTEFTFAVQAAQQLRIDPAEATIRDDSGQTAGKYKVADAIGECITIVADANGDWVTTAKNGTWTEEA